MDTQDIQQQATDEFIAELRREAIEKYKDKLRAQRNRSWIQRLFPWRIIITRV